MSDSLCTKEALELFNSLKPLARNSLVAFNEQRFFDGQEILSEIRTRLELAKSSPVISSDNYLNDLWVIDRYVDFLLKYGLTWESIIEQRFSDSWCSLQDSLDLLRLVKKFSQIDIYFFEDQLVELEEIYPYRVFFSIGMTVEGFECSICGADIDSQECLHIRGYLYGGVMAHAIALNIIQLDHIAMVSHPKDKRCGVSFNDSGEQFKLVRYLSFQIAARKFRISDFFRLQFSKRIRPNPDYRKLGRNEQCFCRSGEKFKYCCINKTHIDGDHVDIVGEERCIEHAVL